MSTPANTVQESFDSGRSTPVVFPVMRLIQWSIRRELWENRSVWIAPLAVAAVGLLSFLIRLIHFQSRMRAVAALDSMAQQSAIQQPYMLVAGLMMVTGMVVGTFYCLDALYGERRDRSILFWKSMPVSDLITVVAKASIPLLILPLLISAISFATHWVMLMLSVAVLPGSGLSFTTWWTQLSFLQMAVMLLYHLVVVHGLWHAPFYGWMLMVSSWARRAPLMWAVLPPAAIVILEKIAFNTSYFGNMLLYQLMGGAESMSDAHSAPIDMLGHFDLAEMLTTPRLWAGLIVTALMLAAAVRLRRDRGPI